MADRRIGGESRKTVRASALQSHAEARKRSTHSPALIGFHQAEESFPNRLRQHRGFGTALLLLHDHQRLIETRISLPQLSAQNRDLRMLTAQAEHGRSRDVRVMDITGDEPAKIA